MKTIRVRCNWLDRVRQLSFNLMTNSEDKEHVKQVYSNIHSKVDIRKAELLIDMNELKLTGSVRELKIEAEWNKLKDEILKEMTNLDKEAKTHNELLIRVETLTAQLNWLVSKFNKFEEEFEESFEEFFSGIEQNEEKIDKIIELKTDNEKFKLVITWFRERKYLCTIRKSKLKEARQMVYDFKQGLCYLGEGEYTKELKFDELKVDVQIAYGFDRNNYKEGLEHPNAPQGAFESLKAN